MKKLTILAFLILPAISFAQIYFGSPIAASNGGSVTATAKNWEAIEINPANLGWEDNHTFSLSIANVGLNFQDNGLNLASQSVISQIENAHSQDSLTPQQRTEMLNAVTQPGGLNISGTINWLAFSFTIPKVGGFGFSVTDKVFFHAQIAYPAAKLITDIVDRKDTNYLKSIALQDQSLLSQSTASLLNGTNAGGYHYRELTFNYGRKLFTINTIGDGGASYQNSEFLDTSKTVPIQYNPIEIFGGIGIKPVYGLGSFSYLISGDQVTEEGTYVYGNNNYLNNIAGNALTANGRGFGTDLGLSVTYKKWALGFSVTDIGSITWHNNSLATATVKLPSNPDSVVKDFTNNGQIVPYFVYHTALPEPDYTTLLPTQFRAGISYKVGKLLTLSSDYVAPLNSVQGNLLAPYYGVGAHLDIYRWIGFGVGYATEKGFGNLMPVGLYINILYGLEIYAGTNDALAYLMSNSNGHVLSGSAGVKIFGF